MFTFPLLRRPAHTGWLHVVRDEGITVTTRVAILRTRLGFIAACGAYLAPFIDLDRKGRKF